MNKEKLTRKLNIFSNFTLFICSLFLGIYFAYELFTKEPPVNSVAYIFAILLYMVISFDSYKDFRKYISSDKSDE